MVKRIKVGAVLTVFLALVGLLTNLNISTSLDTSAGAEETGAAPAPRRFATRTAARRPLPANVPCLTARRDAVPRSRYLALPLPYVNLGFPKMGTSSIHHFFTCGGRVSTHFQCGKGYQKGTTCADCTRASAGAGLPPLARCGPAEVYAQLDNGRYFPQIELLEEFVRGHPNATFFLTFRNMTSWYYSISHWPPRPRGPHKDEQFKMFNITGSPSNTNASHQAEFDDWYCRHVQRVRTIVARYPAHTLVEVDIEDPDIGQHMEEMFGIEKSCWGHRNVNAYIHPELDPSKVTLSKHTKPKKSSTRRKNETILTRREPHVVPNR